MKRDMGLIREMLHFLRDREETSVLKVIPIEGRAEAEIKYHQVLIAQAGFVEFEPIRSKTNERIRQAEQYRSGRSQCSRDGGAHSLVYG
jgi:hypothetical protein